MMTTTPTTTYPSVPDPPIMDGLTAWQHGGQTFAYILDTGLVTLCETIALERALQVSGCAIARPDLLPAVLDRLVDARRLIASTLERRRQTVSVPTGQAPDHTIDGGRPAPLTPVPTAHPPAGAYADVAF